VQIVKPLRIDLHEGSRQEIRLFLIVSLQNNPVAADAERHSPRLVPLFARMLPKPSYDQAVNKAKLAANGKLGILRIGFMSTAGNEIVPTIVRQFRERNAEVEFSLRNILTIDQIQMLEAGSLDIGFLRLPIGEHSELEVVTLHHSWRFIV
jgi:DNA-binding transcriptional LysR family regulator